MLEVDAAEKRPGRNGGTAACVALDLAADLGIEHSSALKTQLLEVHECDGKVELNASKVERIHGAALQLFCLFFREREAAGRETVFVRPTRTLQSAAAVFGVSDLLHTAGSPQ